MEYEWNRVRISIEAFPGFTKIGNQTVEGVRLR